MKFELSAKLSKGLSASYIVVPPIPLRGISGYLYIPTFVCRDVRF